METIREIIRGIAIIIIFAGFLEMLLPDNEMRRYIQLVVGLFVIVSVISPLTKLVSLGGNLDVAAWQPVTNNTAQIIDKGKQIAVNEQERLLAGTQGRVLAQISALAKLHSEVEKVGVKILQPRNATEGDKVQIQLTFVKGIGIKQKASIADKVKETITAFFNYPAENILLTWEGEE
jgi:stage III sporulation protein AF